MNGACERDDPLDPGISAVSRAPSGEQPGQFEETMRALLQRRTTAEATVCGAGSHQPFLAGALIRQGRLRSEWHRVRMLMKPPEFRSPGTDALPGGGLIALGLVRAAAGNVVRQPQEPLGHNFPPLLSRIRPQTVPFVT